MQPSLEGQRCWMAEEQSGAELEMPRKKWRQIQNTFSLKLYLNQTLGEVTHFEGDHLLLAYPSLKTPTKTHMSSVLFLNPVKLIVDVSHHTL